MKKSIIAAIAILTLTLGAGAAFAANAGIGHEQEQTKQHVMHGKNNGAHSQKQTPKRNEHGGGHETGAGHNMHDMQRTGKGQAGSAN